MSDYQPITDAFSGLTTVARQYAEAAYLAGYEAGVKAAAEAIAKAIGGDDG